MGQASRIRPERLAQKLLHIRTTLGLSQNGLIRHLGLTELLSQNAISAFEQGRREPPLPVLLQYARVAGVWMDVLVDDELDLPAKLPTATKPEGIPYRSASGTKSKR
jgi:transcriptional regulator with XRE-family HTH domain